MATNKNITMKQYNGLDYDTLYPKTTPEQVGAVSYEAQTLTDGQKTQARKNINAAPGGYGLGDHSKTLSAADDLNNIRVTGWYSWAWNSHPQNAPDNNWGIYGCAMYVFAVAPGAVAIQTVFDLSDDITHGCAIQRTIHVESSGNIYYPWEWVKPPMKLGIEYRTTERYLGKPVYTQIINCGSMPDIGSRKDVSIAAFNVAVVTFISGWCSYYAAMFDDTLLGMTMTANTSNIVIKNLNREVNSNAVMYALVKYTKTTD